MASETDDMKYWDGGSKLGCPMLRGNAGGWIALNEDPCPSGKCGCRSCHNFKKEFEEQGRLTIVKTAIVQDASLGGGE